MITGPNTHQELYPASKVDVIRSRTAVSGMRFGQIQDQPGKWLRGKPVRNLTLQNTFTCRARSIARAIPALARYNQDQAEPTRMSVHDETAKFGKRTRSGHSVKVDTVLGGQLSASQPFIRL